jgi:hypothetical protein
MTENYAEQFRRGRGMRREAETARSLLDREVWLKLAADWINLAEGAEQGRRTSLESVARNR